MYIYLGSTSLSTFLYGLCRSDFLFLLFIAIFPLFPFVLPRPFSSFLALYPVNGKTKKMLITILPHHCQQISQLEISNIPAVFMNNSQ